jgi:hypothetical protein
MPTNDFLPFATGGGANVMSQGDWLALAARSAGFSAGVASSAQLNKAWRQSGFMAAALAKFLSDTQNVDVPDDGDMDAMVARLRRSFGAGFTTLSSNTTLTPAQAGTVFVSAASGNITLTLPAVAAVGAGVSLEYTFIRTDSSANTLTIQRAGSDLIEGGTTFALAIGTRTTLHGDGGSVWRVGPEAGVGRNIAMPGWQRLPGGLIMQWGDAAGDAAVTLPVAFPTKGLVVFAIDSDNDPAVCGASFNSAGPNVTQVLLYGIDVNWWLALGH